MRSQLRAACSDSGQRRGSLKITSEEEDASIFLGICLTFDMTVKVHMMDDPILPVLRRRGLSSISAISRKRSTDESQLFFWTGAIYQNTNENDKYGRG